MTKSDQLWQQFITAAQTRPDAETSSSAPPNLVERVLAEAAKRSDRSRRERHDLRTAAWFTAITVAVSVLFMVSSWESVTEILQPPPMVRQDLLDWDLQL